MSWPPEHSSNPADPPQWPDEDADDADADDAPLAPAPRWPADPYIEPPPTPRWPAEQHRPAPSDGDRLGRLVRWPVQQLLGRRQPPAEPAAERVPRRPAPPSPAVDDTRPARRHTDAVSPASEPGDAPDAGQRTGRPAEFRWPSDRVPTRSPVTSADTPVRDRGHGSTKPRTRELWDGGHAGAERRTRGFGTADSPAWDRGHTGAERRVRVGEGHPEPAVGDPWPELPDDGALWTVVRPAFQVDHVRRLELEQRGW